MSNTIRFAACEAALQHTLQMELPGELLQLKARVHQLEAQNRQLEEQQLSTCLRADGTRKTHAEVANDLRRVVTEERDANEWLEGNIEHATQILEAAYAQADPASVNMHAPRGSSASADRGQTKEVLVRALAGEVIGALEGRVQQDPPSDIQGSPFESPPPSPESPGTMSDYHPRRPD
jgi:hypothetical protein